MCFGTDNRYSNASTRRFPTCDKEACESILHPYSVSISVIYEGGMWYSVFRIHTLYVYPCNVKEAVFFNMSCLRLMFVLRLLQSVFDFACVAIFC